MRRKIAIALTAAIFAAIAVCFLRPVDEPYISVSGNLLAIVGRELDGEVEAEKGVKFLPIGDSDLIETTVSLSSMEGYNALRFRARSLDEDRSYICKASIWEDGEEVGVLPKGYIENIRTGELLDFASEVSFTTYVCFASGPDGVYGSWITPDKEREFSLLLPELETGDYRLTVYFYDFDTESGTIISEEPHELHFDLRYELPDSELSILGAGWARGAMPYSGADVSLLIYARDARWYIDSDATKMERREGGEWVDCTDKIKHIFGGSLKHSGYCGADMPADTEIGDYRLTFVIYSDSGNERRTIAVRLHYDQSQN